MAILMSWRGESLHIKSGWTNFFVGHISGPTVERYFHQVPILQLDTKGAAESKVKQMFSRKLCGEVFPCYKNAKASSLDVSVATVLGL